MYIPELVKSNRSREYSNYTHDQRAKVVMAYLFCGMSHRQLDKKILNLDWESNGYQSMNILHYLGLVNAHKGIFKTLSIQAAIQSLENAANDDFSEIIKFLNQCQS